MDGFAGVGLGWTNDCSEIFHRLLHTFLQVLARVPATTNRAKPFLVACSAIFGTLNLQIAHQRACGRCWRVVAADAGGGRRRTSSDGAAWLAQELYACKHIDYLIKEADGAYRQRWDRRRRCVCGVKTHARVSLALFSGLLPHIHFLSAVFPSPPPTSVAGTGTS